MSERDDKKRDPQRIELLGGLAGEVMVFQPMTIREISTGGMQIETSLPLQLDSLHDFRLTLSGGRSLVIKGRVVHSHISDVDQDVVRYRSGIEFIEPAERVIVTIADFMELLRRSHASRGPHLSQIDSAD